LENGQGHFKVKGNFANSMVDLCHALYNSFARWRTSTSPLL